jgi:beta-lactam-binding protein with PASTA domain
VKRPGVAKAKAPREPRAKGGRWPAPVRRVLWLVGGVAVMAGAGYLLAAVVLFPAPLLPNERSVPRLRGQTLEAARTELKSAGFVPEVAEREPHPSAAVGTVIGQDPPPGVAVPRGDTVALTVSAGPPRVAVPGVNGLDPDLAQRLVRAAGLRVELTDTVPGSLPAGIVAGTTPPAGDSLRAGSTLVLHLSKGPR